MTTLDKETVKDAAAGRWLDILTAAGAPREVLDGRHHPCPKCGGNDRFRLVDADAGAVLCNQCLSQSNGDGLSAVQWLRGCDFPDAVQFVADYLGVEPANGKAAAMQESDMIEAVARSKAMPLDAFRRFRPRAAKRAGVPVARVPVYNHEGKPHSHFDLSVHPKADDKLRKGKFKFGKGSGGLFLPDGKVPASGEGWLLVEGVKDAAALLDLCGGKAKVAGLPKSDLPAEFAHLFRGANVIIVADRDKPGEAGARRTAARLAGIAESIRVATLPGELKDADGDDVRDVLRKHGADAVRQAIKAAKPWDAGQDEAAVAQTIHDEILRKLKLDVLGEWDDQSVEIYSYHHRKARRVRDVERMKYAKLLQLAGEPAMRYVHNSQMVIPDKFSIAQVREAICTVAGRQELDHDSLLGMGCWRGRDVAGNDTNSVVVVNARQAGVWNGHMKLERIDHPRHGGLLLRIANVAPWVGLEQLASLCEAAESPEWCGQAITDATSEFDRWKWKQSQAPEILACLVAATWIQSLWSYRPQVSITGQSNAGKTFLFNTLDSIFGGLSEKLSSDSTAIGLAQSVGHDSRVLLVDEWDRIRPKNRDAIFSMIRRSTRGDRRAVGTQGQKAKTTGMKNIWWTAGIMSNLADEADRNRFISFELIPPRRDQHGKLTMQPADLLAMMGQRLLAVAVRHAIAAVELADELRGLIIPDVHPRYVESYAVPAAIHATACGLGRDGGESLLREYLESLGEQREVERDDEALLSAILESHVDAGRELGRLSVAQLLDIVRRRNSAVWDAAKDALEKVGLSAERDSITGEESLVIAHNAVSRHLLRGTDWEGKTIGEVLRRVPGAAYCARRIAGSKPRCYEIPIAAAGLEPLPKSGKESTDF